MLNAKFACDWRLIAYNLYPSGRQSHANCTHMALVACNMNKIDGNLHVTGGHAGTNCMRLEATQVQFACDWRPLGYKTRDKQTRGV
jgi:hypothetical protein